ncbi:MAG: peptide ABC transporter substrate-binding protein [Armatimonadetes bacterium]|nr:peptide ABC transporter substrate-binding protein [Armatimonadota bacterium]
MLRLICPTVVVVMTLALAISLFPAVAAAQRRDAVVIGTAQEPAGLGPWWTLAVGVMVENSVSQELVSRNEKWQLIPVLAEKVPTIKDGDWEVLPGGKMRLTWKIRRGLTWHDGKPLTALDVRVTYGMLRNPRSPTVSRFILRKIDNMLVPNENDPYTLIEQWNERYPFANDHGRDWPHRPYPRHILEPTYLSDPAKLRAHPYFRAPIGSGPFKFKEWVAGSHTTFEAYEAYKGPGGSPRIRTLTYRYILDSTVLQANVIAGQVDATDINNFSCEQMAQIERRNSQVAAHYIPALLWEHVDFNHDHPWLKDKRVRQAIAHALDRSAISEVSCLGGRQPVAHTWLPQRHYGYNPNVKKYDYSPDRARALLAEAGWATVGPDGIRRNARGERFEISIMTTAGNAIREQTQQIMKDHLRAVGIDLKIDNRPASVLFGQITRRRQYPHLVMYAWVFSPVTDGFALWHSRQIPREANNYEGNNTPGYSNPEVDRLEEAIVQELDEAKRKQLLMRQQEIWAEDLPSIPLVFRLALLTNKKSIRNVKPVQLGSVYLPWNANEWQQ